MSSCWIDRKTLICFFCFYGFVLCLFVNIYIGKKKKPSVQSVEPMVADLCNGWLKEYDLKYYLEQDCPNDEIAKALGEYESKNGGSGGNRPDANLLIQGEDTIYYPILIEYKGYKDRLVKLDADGQVENKKQAGEPHYNNISNYAVNGAVHYANALLQYTGYEHIISIGVTGYKDELEQLRYSIGVYYVSRLNYGAGQKVGEFSDLSFLRKDNFEQFIEQIHFLSLSAEE